MLDGLQFSSPTELSVGSVLLNLACAGLLSFILAWHFQTFGSSFSNRRKFANVLPFMPDDCSSHFCGESVIGSLTWISGRFVYRSLSDPSERA